MSDLDLSQLVCQEISDLLNSIDSDFVWEVESYFESMEDHYEAFKNDD
jgi:DNA replication initiation complex subunit (GINS family)